jgi:surface protein
MFAGSIFNGNISEWNTGNVEDMSGMFLGSEFNQDISNWNTSEVSDMDRMFYNSAFNQDIENWNIENVIIMNDIFSKDRYTTHSLYKWTLQNTRIDLKNVINPDLLYNFSIRWIEY